MSPHLDGARDVDRFGEGILRHGSLNRCFTLLLALQNIDEGHEKVGGPGRDGTDDLPGKAGARSAGVAGRINQLLKGAM